MKNGPSPGWVQDRLKSIGLRPISALVDVTNLIAHDRGRPLHVFDADKLDGDMQARLAKDGETLLALDGKTYALDAEMCLIADAVAARGIAGVMGGEDTGCSEATTNVFIESALFDPVRTAATGRKLGNCNRMRAIASSAASIPNSSCQVWSLPPGSSSNGAAGSRPSIVVAGAVPPWRREIEFSPGAVKRLGGLDVPKEEIVRILTNLGFAVEGAET